MAALYDYEYQIKPERAVNDSTKMLFDTLVTDVLISEEEFNTFRAEVLKDGYILYNIKRYFARYYEEIP